MSSRLAAALAAVLLLGAVNSAAAQAAPSPEPWWRLFADPVLDRLVEQADRQSTTIAQAAARLAQAQAAVGGVKAAGMPQAGVSAAGSRRTGPLINAAGGSGGLLNASVDFTYQLDVLGRMGLNIKAARRDVQAREAQLTGARLLVEAGVVQTYMQLRARDEELALLAQAAADQRDALRLAEGRRDAGLESELSLTRTRAELGGIEAEALGAARARGEAEHALAYLTGEPATTFKVAVGALPTNLPQMAEGAPDPQARPDIAASQNAEAAAELRLRAAKRAWAPFLAVGASGGLAASDLAALFESTAQSFGLNVLVALPVLDGGRRKAMLAGARADLALASADHRDALLRAYQDMEDQVMALQAAQARADVLRGALEADRRATRMLTTLYRDGLASRVEVIDAHRTELRDARAALDARAATFANTAGVVRAFGGVWASAPSTR